MLFDYKMRTNLLRFGYEKLFFLFQKFVLIFFLLKKICIFVVEKMTQ